MSFCDCKSNSKDEEGTSHNKKKRISLPPARTPAPHFPRKKQHFLSIDSFDFRTKQFVHLLSF